MNPRDQFPNFQSLLDQIRKRPGMFFGHKSVYGLGTYLYGIWFAELLYSVPEDQILQGFDQSSFEKWVADKFNPRRLSLNSFSLAHHLTTSDAEAFDLWFQWYDEFRVEALNNWRY